ncbi:hypothetical protein ABH904_002193 [Pseudomonas frederiksbergensis]
MAGQKALWLLSRFSKVTRRKGGTASGRYRRNGYVLQKRQTPDSESTECRRALASITHQQ